ncbi:PREDICTED: protocadherin-10 [Crocodylus porosus]|uniref:protocadherin-10 n=1 Tax=Crocodylus porosus TaxID=8502 RepID=UPI00093DEFFF|nr:PREDICTED: protocadherin-10 [Crocodylus porosus]
MVLLSLVAWLWLAEGARAQLRYTVQEEQEHGTFVGNIAEDLGLDVTKLSARRFQAAPNSRSPYLALDLETGVLSVNEKMDREQICKQSPACLLHLEVFLENPLELFRVEVEVLDINDNPPAFPEPDLTVEISESATPGTRLPLESAFDPDVGTNALRTYELTPNAYFSLDVQTQPGDGSRFAELVLQQALDREQQALHRYVLTAVDGGQPQARTGTALLSVRVLDSNDNVPAFEQAVYAVALAENSPPGTLVLQLNASDPDEGANGEVLYSFSSHISARAREVFGLAPRTGRLEVAGELDYEESSAYQVYVQAKDLGPNAVPAHCKVLVRLLDANDNAPEISFSTVKEAVSEAAAPGTVVALFSVSDRDSAENGEVRCELVQAGAAPFRLKSSFKNYYTIVTEGALDREQPGGDAYTLTVVARDGGRPPLSATHSIQVRVSDVNDNAPRFSQPRYRVQVSENNVPGAYIFAVSATDRDAGANARLAYAILDGQIQGMSVFTYVSINAENGFLYALRSFDYEQLKEFSFQVQARDAGEEPQALAANATVHVAVLDQNDNAPAVVSPLPGRNGTPARELLPRGAEPGYLVSRVAAVDADDGDNARLTYSLARGNEAGLFRLDWRSGELRTARRVPAKRDAQRPYDLLVEHSQNYCYQVCLTPESAKTDLMFLKPCSPARSADAEHSPCGAIVTAYADQQPDIISNGSILSSETKHQRAELSYLVDRPRRVNSSAFQEADIVSSKDSGHGDSEQGDSDHDATNRGQSSGMDLFSNCTEECKALGHSDRCWMPSFVPSDGRQAADYRSNLHVPGMDSVPDTEVFETPEAQPGAERSFSTFGKEKALHNTLERKELDGLLSNTRAPYKPPYLIFNGESIREIPACRPAFFSAFHLWISKWIIKRIVIYALLHLCFDSTEKDMLVNSTGLT